MPDHGVAESFEMANGFSYMSNAVNAAYSSAKARFLNARNLSPADHVDIDELSVRRNSDGSFHVNFKVYEHDTKGPQAAAGHGAGEG